MKYFSFFLLFFAILSADEIFLNLEWNDYITLKKMERKYSVQVNYVDIHKILVRGDKEGIVSILKEFYALKNNKDIVRINREIDHISLKSGIPDWVLKIIVEIESNYTNNILALRANKNIYDFLIKLEKIAPVTIKFYKPNRIVITGDKKAIEDIAKELYVKEFPFDLGLAQINSMNFKFDEIPYLLDVKYNLIKANNILADCSNYFNISFKDTIECYNKGFNKQNSYVYFNRFLNTYIQNYTEDLRK